MAIQIHNTINPGVFEIDLSGKLAAEDYESFLPEINRLMHNHGKLRLLIQMRDFHGWTPGGFWEEFKFDIKHVNDVERIAFVGDKKWEAGLSKLAKLFTTDESRFFEPAQIEEARGWLSAG